MKVLVVEDDHRAAKQLVSDLAEIGHAAVVATDGRAAMALASSERFDAILLDVMLPHIDGMAVAARLREAKMDVPIVMLTALGDLDQRLAGLEAGADDYLVKPAAPAEIDARLRAIVRRSVRRDESGILVVGDIEVNILKHRASRAGRMLMLQNLEFKLLCELVRNAGSIVTRKMLYQNVWQYDFEPTTNIVDSYIRRLRVRLNAPGERDPISTIRGVGYMLTEG